MTVWLILYLQGCIPLQEEADNTLQIVGHYKFFFCCFTEVFFFFYAGLSKCLEIKCAKKT